MVAYDTVVYFVSLFALLFLYTVCWDLYTGFFTLAIAAGGDSVILGYMYTIHEWIPAALFLSLTFWYLVQAQRRTV